MAEFSTTKLNAEQHLLLDQPLLRMPYELARKNFKTAQRYVEREQTFVTKELKNAANGAAQAATTGDASATLSQLDTMINRMQGLKRKLETLHTEETTIHKATKTRIQHLDDLYGIPSLADVKYDEWSKVRLDRLLVDYLLRSGYGDSAKALAKEKGIEELVDVDAFVQCERIAESLRRGRCQEALAWCGDNKQGLKKLEVRDPMDKKIKKEAEAKWSLDQYWRSLFSDRDCLIEQCPSGCHTQERDLFEEVANLWTSNLEFELRLQQYVEMVRTGTTQKLQEATQHARKYLASHSDTKYAIRAAGLLAFPPDTPAEPYKDDLATINEAPSQTLYSTDRWPKLAELFIKTHNTLYSLPPNPLLHIALSAGLSALKTPSCHSQYASSSSNANSTSTSVCPICSTELNELARNVPYAHHTKSFVENDPVVLPTGRIYGRARLMEMNAKLGTPKGFVKDPMVPNLIYEESQLKKVFIS
ncbi:GID complex subunit containing RING finger motif [Diplodia intermedia]|uniref:GID complex subunit containing RING finger motif n=1 Tax=Diplodia intermedia TaxID=856260 RepID=A0ABR3TPU6_9PEZI